MVKVGKKAVKLGKKQAAKKEPEVEAEADAKAPAEEKRTKKVARKGRDAAAKKSAKRKGHPEEVKAAGPADEGEAFEEGPDPKKKRVKSKAHRLEAEEEEGEEKIPRGVLYLGNIPHGFYEPQMRTFFEQFGKVIRLRLARTKRTASSKGFGFIEFEDEEVAEIVAKTMDKYILAGKVMKCHVMNKDKIHPGLFRGHNRVKMSLVPLRTAKFVKLYNDRPLAEVEGIKVPQITKRQVLNRAKKDHKLKNKLSQYGIEFDFDHLEGEGAAGKKALEEWEQHKEKRSAEEEAKKKEAAAAAPKLEKKRKASDTDSDSGEAAPEEEKKEQKEQKDQKEEGKPATKKKKKAGAKGSTAAAVAKAPAKKK